MASMTLVVLLQLAVDASNLLLRDVHAFVGVLASLLQAAAAAAAHLSLLGLVQALRNRSNLCAVALQQQARHTRHGQMDVHCGRGSKAVFSLRTSLMTGINLKLVSHG